MLRKHGISSLIAFGLVISTFTSALALENGPLLANNILGGAMSGAVYGLAAGTLAYGLDNNYHAEYLLTGACYGFLGGALLGGGVAFYEISSQRPDTGFTLSGYLAGGTGIGALLGVVVATIPYLRDKDPEDFTTGLGLGGLIGGTLGLAAAFIDINARNAEGRALLTGKVGILKVAACLPNSRPDAKPEPLYHCEVVRLTF